MNGLKRGTVQVVPYRPVWKDLFRSEAVKLRSALGNHLLQIEHVGSTSIEGMDAKPIIDIIVALKSLDKTKALVPVLQTLGYNHKEDDDVPSRAFFVKGSPSQRTYHLSLTELESGYWKAHILFRDYLQTHGEVAEEYRLLKRELVEQYSDDRGSYTAGKEIFVERVLKLAGADT